MRIIGSAVSARLLVHAAVTRHAPPAAGLFDQFFQPQASPADVYSPDLSAPLPGLPREYKSIYASAVEGVQAAMCDGVSGVEIDFPPLANVNALSDGSAKSERQVHEANAVAAASMMRALGPSTKNLCVIGCSRGARSALRDACDSVLDLRDDVPADAVVICVQPTAEEQWDAVAALRCRCVIVLNGLLNNGRLPHAYYYKPMTAFSQITGGVVRRYPGPYAAYAIDGECIELELGLTTQGKRALPDTKDAQMALQNRYGRR